MAKNEVVDGFTVGPTITAIRLGLQLYAFWDSKCSEDDIMVVQNLLPCEISSLPCCHHSLPLALTSLLKSKCIQLWTELQDSSRIGK